MHKPIKLKKKLYTATYNTGLGKVELLTTQENQKKALDEAYWTFWEQGYEPTKKSIKLKKV